MINYSKESKYQYAIMLKKSILKLKPMPKLPHYLKCLVKKITRHSKEWESMDCSQGKHWSTGKHFEDHKLWI